MVFSPRQFHVTHTACELRYQLETIFDRDENAIVIANWHDPS